MKESRCTKRHIRYLFNEIELDHEDDCNTLPVHCVECLFVSSYSLTVRYKDEYTVINMLIPNKDFKENA